MERHAIGQTGRAIGQTGRGVQRQEQTQGPASPRQHRDGQAILPAGRQMPHLALCRLRNVLVPQNRGSVSGEKPIVFRFCRSVAISSSLFQCRPIANDDPGSR